MYVFVYVMMSRMIAKEIIRSYSRRQRRGHPVQQPIDIVSNCDVCGGLMFNAQRYMHMFNAQRYMHMFNAQRYMHMHDAYFAPSTIRFPYELKKIFDRNLYEQRYLHKEHPQDFTLDLDQLVRISECRFIQRSNYSFPVTNVELEYRFDTLGFLWLHHDNPLYLLYRLEKLVGGLSEERTRPATTTIGYNYYSIRSHDRYQSWRSLLQA